MSAWKDHPCDEHVSKGLTANGDLLAGLDVTVGLDGRQEPGWREHDVGTVAVDSQSVTISTAGE